MYALNTAIALEVLGRPTVLQTKIKIFADRLRGSTLTIAPYPSRNTNYFTLVFAVVHHCANS